MPTFEQNPNLETYLRNDDQLFKVLLAVYRGNQVGLMSSVLMHDVNQPLVAIRLNAELLIHRLHQEGASDLTQKIAKNILTISDGAIDLLARLRGFLSFKKDVIKRIDLGVLLEDIGAIAMIECQANQIQLQFNIAPNLIMVGDTDQLRMAVSAILSNAVDALRGAQGPRNIFVQLEGDGQLIRLRICDSGAGLSASDNGHLYEMLYTTKSGHFGLGLWLCKSILDNHQATVTASNAEGSGACFMLTFPRCLD